MFEITLSGPGKNSLSTAMMDFLLAKLSEAGSEPVLLTGAGDAFCAGLNLKELGGLDPAGIEAYLRKLEYLVETLFLYPGPIVAWLNGHAIAGGAVLGLCCDHIVASANPKSRIGLNEVALGLLFPPVTLAMLRTHIPPRFLNEVLLGAGLFDPPTALRLGFVDEVADDVSAAHQRLEALASHPRLNYAATKRLLRVDVIEAAKAGVRFNSILPTWRSPELRERILGALKK